MHHHQLMRNECEESLECGEDPTYNVQQSCSRNESKYNESISKTQRDLLVSHDPNFSQQNMKQLTDSEDNENRIFASKFCTSEPKIPRHMVEDGTLFFQNSDSFCGSNCVPIQKKFVEEPTSAANENYNQLGQNHKIYHQESELRTEEKTKLRGCRQVENTHVTWDEKSSRVNTKNLQGITRSVRSTCSVENQQSTSEMSYGGLERDQQILTTSVDATESEQTKHKFKVFGEYKPKYPDEKIKMSMQESELSSTEPVKNKRNSCDSYGIWNIFSNFLSSLGFVQGDKESMKVKALETQKTCSPENKKWKDERNGKNIDQRLVLPSHFSKTHGRMNCSKINPDDDKNTLENALKIFELSPRLRELEKSIEEVRTCKRTKEEHEQLLKQIDKEMQKLSLKYHPDRVRNKEGTEEDVAEAQKMQTTLNATRTVLKVLSATFLEDICTDHKYGFYKKLHMRSLGNENEIKNCIYDVLFKISMISEIKQECIIPEIRNFLTESNSCIKEYLGDNVSDFKKHRDLALLHLQCCIEGYRKLHLELEDVEKQCEYEKLDNVSSVIVKMTSECKREQTLLKKLQKTAQRSPSNYNFFRPHEPMNPYFVLPFVSYVNVILMCSVMIKELSWYERQKSRFQPVPKHGEDDDDNDGELSDLMNLYYLTSYYSGNRNREKALKIMCDGINPKLPNDAETNEDTLHKKCQEAFKEILSGLSVVLESKFKINNYVESSSKNILMKELEQCMKVMAEFNEKKEELLKDIEKLQKNNEVMEQKCDKLLQESKEFDRNIAETLEKSRKSMELASQFLSNRP